MFRYAVAIGAVLALGLHGGSGISVPDAVEIHPQNLTSLDVAPYSTNTQRFWIVNSGDQANQYSIFANVCSPYDLYCDWSNTFLGTIRSRDRSRVYCRRRSRPARGPRCDCAIACGSVCRGGGRGRRWCNSRPRVHRLLL